jgi:hypothetical protein
MRKATVIATCLRNSGSRFQMQEIESSIEQTFKEEFAGSDFKQWNTDLPAATASNIIGQFGNAYTIDVRQLIIDLM